MNILKYYKSKHHPQMEPFPVLKKVWGEAECQVLREIEHCEDSLYRMTGIQLDETERAYPEETNGIPRDDWPEEIQEIWEYWEEEMSKVEEKKDELYDEIIEIEKERYTDLDPVELTLMEMRVEMIIPHKMDRKWGILKLVDSLDYKYKYFKNKDIPRFKENATGTGVTILRVPIKDLPIELVEVDYASDEQVRQEAERLASYGVEWIEEQERMLLGLESNN